MFKIKFINLIKEYQGDVRLTLFPFVLEVIMKLDEKRVDFDKSYIEVYRYNEPSELYNVYFYPYPGANILPIHIWLDMSFQVIYVGFENFGEHLYLERIAIESNAVYQKCFNEIVTLKFKKEYFGTNGLIRNVSYKGFFEDDVYLSRNIFRFVLTQKYFWQKDSVLLKEEFYEPLFIPRSSSL